MNVYHHPVPAARDSLFKKKSAMYRVHYNVRHLIVVAVSATKCSFMTMI